MCDLKVEDLKSLSIDELIKWRNNASSRVSKIDSDTNYLANVVYDSVKKAIKLNKKRRNDVRWIVHLNKALDFKVFKNRS